MGTCFVMQPFDKDVFDQRYEDVIAPAIRDADLEPYRIDQDPKVSIPIQDIEAGIREADICLAEITKDNPNVWFELGYAIACRKEVVLICSKERKERFPFDIQHRTIITYNTGSPRDFETLRGEITQKVRAYLKKAETLTTISEISKTAKFEGLDQHEIVCLAAIAENLEHPQDHVSVYLIKRDMETAGFTKVAATLALASLLQKGFVEQGSYGDHDVREYYTAYSLLEPGWKWILGNKEQFALRKPEELPF